MSAAVGLTLITLVMTSFSSDGSGLTDDEGTPNVIETTFVTPVILAEESEIFSRESRITEERAKIKSLRTGGRAHGIWSRLSLTKDRAIDEQACEPCRVEAEPKENAGN